MFHLIFSKFLQKISILNRIIKNFLFEGGKKLLFQNHNRSTFLWSIERNHIVKGYLFGTIHVPFTEVWEQGKAFFISIFDFRLLGQY